MTMTIKRVYPEGTVSWNQLYKKQEKNVIFWYHILDNYYYILIKMNPFFSPERLKVSNIKYHGYQKIIIMFLVWYLSSSVTM